LFELVKLVRSSVARNSDAITDSPGSITGHSALMSPMTPIERSRLIAGYRRTAHKIQRNQGVLRSFSAL
jgi:hypothetical protein